MPTRFARASAAVLRTGRGYLLGASNRRIQRSRRNKFPMIQSTPLGGPLMRVVRHWQQLYASTLAGRESYCVEATKLVCS
jgi:hypothetical protein